MRISDWSSDVCSSDLYLESYYLYDLHEPEDHQRPYFLYNHIRHNEFSVNLAYLKGTYQGEKLRANLAFMAGTYAQYNLSAEEDMLKHLYEANIGLRLGAGTWLDAGVLTSYIGFERAASQIGKDSVRERVLNIV